MGGDIKPVPVKESFNDKAAIAVKFELDTDQ